MYTLPSLLPAENNLNLVPAAVPNPHGAASLQQNVAALRQGIYNLTEK